MLQNAYFLAKIGADTAENEQHFAEILPTDAALPTVPTTPVSNDVEQQWATALERSSCVLEAAFFGAMPAALEPHTTDN